jgi:hypothetical protein
MATKTNNDTLDYLFDDESNYCIECGVDMGPMNPRQLCGKWYCLNASFLDDETVNNNDDAKYNEEPETKKSKQTKE